MVSLKTAHEEAVALTQVRKEDTESGSRRVEGEVSAKAWQEGSGDHPIQKAK